MRLQETRVGSLGQEGALEKEMATHSSILAWEMPRTEEPDGPQSMGRSELGTAEQLRTEASPRPTLKCVCAWRVMSCLSVCLSASPSRCLAVCLRSFVSFCLCLSRQPAAGRFVWPRPLMGAMALAEELAPGGCLPGRGCGRVSVRLSVCLPVARLLSPEGGVLGGRPGGKGAWPQEGKGRG